MRIVGAQYILPEETLQLLSRCPGVRNVELPGERLRGNARGT